MTTEQVAGLIPLEFLMRRIVRALEGYSYRMGGEADVQKGIGFVLQNAGLSFEREVILSKADRPDFLVDGRVVIEVKVSGSLAEALPQCRRYLEHDRIRGCILAATRSWAFPGWNNPIELHGKPLQFARLSPNAF